jgi:hypothetical protein
MDGDRNRNRGASGDVRKVALFMQYERNGLGPARQPDRQAVAEPEGRVVPAVRNPHQKSVAEVGPLFPHEALDGGVTHVQRGWWH